MTVLLPVTAVPACFQDIPSVSYTHLDVYKRQALARAEPVDVFPLLRPFALGLCIMFFPTLVLGTLKDVYKRQV